VRLEESSERRAELFGRIGELCRDVLGDDVGAIAAFRSRAEAQPSDDGALAALDGLYEKAGRWRDLVLVLERRRDLADGSARRSLMTRSAKVLAERLSSPQEAIAAWRAVVDEFGPDDESLHALEQLFRATERWDELAETYEQHLDIVTSDGRRLELLADLGDLRQAHLSDPAGALVAYRVALKVTATHGRSRRALEALLDAQDASIRRDSAEVLRPIFEVDGDHAKLLKVLEIEVDTADDPLDKLEKLDKAIQVAEGSLGDAERAHSYARRAVRTAVGHTELSPWLTRLEGLAERTDRLAEYVALLEEIVPEIFDGDVQLAVTLRIADLARNRLGDRERARQYYDRALELRADDPTALLALESLYEESNDAPNLLTILERRVEIAASDEERKALHFRRAVLLADVLGDRARAIEVYELILEIGLDPRALVALETLYTAESRWADLIALYERELESTTNAAALHVKIARVAAQRQKDLGRAFEELERALELERQHTGAIEELERLLAEADDAEPRARAAVLLEPVYLVRADFSRVMATLRARLAFSQDPEERRELLARLAQLYEEQQEDYVQALETTARLLHEDITSESTMAELERLAKVAGAARRLAEVYAGEVALHESDDEATARIARRAAELFVELGELERALVLYQRVLAFAPEDAAVFTATDRLLERMGRHEERIELQRHALDHRFEPVERLAIFHTVARLERRELGRPDAAIDTYREALDVDESDVTALDALTELYAERGRHTDLGELYLRRAEAAERVEQSAQFRLSLARLYRKELKDDDRAIEQLEEIVRGQSGHAEAIRELEALLTEPALKERVVDILRPLYEAQDNWRHTIKLNEERFALAGAPGDQVAVLRETAELWEKRGNDQDKARRALRHAFEIDPDDAEVRQDLERLTGATRSWLDLADLYDAALEARPDLASARDLLEVVSRIADERLDDPRRALGAYRRLFRADPTELLPLEKVEQLAILLSDWPVLVEALAAKAELLLEDAERASAWRRIGEAKRDMLEDADGAVAAYEQALELEPDSSFTVDCLIGLYEERSEPERLVELLERRVELAGDSDPDQVYELLVQAASVYEERLADRPKAIDVAARALAVKPGDAAALARLDRLYRAEERWSELLDNLRLEASLAESVEDRARLRREMGRVLADKLDSPEEAVEAYRLVLDESPRDADTVQAVRLIAERHEELRSRVAALLEPVLRSTERWEELTAVLELRLGTESDPAERAATLRAIADVNETRLGRPGQALEAVLRAIAERPEDMALHTEAERLAELASGYPEYADALSERAEATFDPETAKDLFSRLGRIADEKLKDDARAVEAYGRALEQGGDDLALLEALDRIHTRTGDARALADVLERRSTLEPSDEAQAELSYRLGLLQIRDFEEPGRGLASLRQALERVPSHRGALEELEKLTAKRELFEEASEVLEGVYRTLADNGKLAWLYEKRVDRAEDRGARVEQRKNLARVLEEDVKDPSRAQQVLQAALADDPADSGLLDELERLAAVNSAFPAAAEALRNAVDARGELLPEVSRDLTVRAALWLRDRTNDRDGAERAYVKALTFDPASDEVLEAIAELQSAAGRERDLAATLRKRAKLQVDDERRVELYKRARELAAGLADAALAEEVLRELLAQDEANAWALAELTELRAAAGDHKETYALLIRRIDVAVGGEELFALRHRAAKLAREELGKPELAIELYQALFDDRPEDVVASQALRELYAQAAAWQDLGRLLERLIDMADSPEARANLRIELARLEAERDRAYDRAIELLRAVLEELPGHGQAVVALSELFEQTKRDEELAELLDGQIAAARERGDQESELTFLMRLGEICVSRLDDKRRAVETYEAVLARDPRHRRALESLAQLYASLDQGAEAARVLETLLDLSSGAEAVELAATLADTRSKLGDTDGVARALERGLAAEERNATLRSRLAALYEANQDYEKLAALIARSAELTDAVPEQVKLLRQAAELQATKRQDRAAAARLLERASELDPSNRELLLELCDAYSASGKGAAAVQVLEKIVESFGGKRSKELAEIHRRLADAYLAENEKEKALGELDKAFRIEPGNVTVLKKLGEVALDAGDLKKAQQMFRALLLQRLDEKSPITKAEVFFMLGEVHLKENDLPKAKQQYERAVQTDSSFTRAKQRLEELK
jgi:tetratricopeptide (TPR) repeat protein